MAGSWVDFKAIKQVVGIAAVLNRYGIKLKQVGDELRGRCPIHKGEGQETFHANIAKNAFHCFSCGAKGNVLDFVAALEQCSVRQAALRLQDWFVVTGDSTAGGVTTRAESARSSTPEHAQDRGEPNRLLGFRLKDVRYDHPYLSGRGVDTETAEYFGIGYFGGKGTMHGRIIIPIDNEEGELIAYAGRAIDGAEPKYKLPAGFKKRQVVYNLRRAVEDSDGTAVLVEGFFDCVRVAQAGFPCVALMGCSLSLTQEKLLATHFRRMIVLLDGDKAGRTAAFEIAAKLVQQLWVRVADVGDDRQPDEVPPDELRLLLCDI